MSEHLAREAVVVALTELVDKSIHHRTFGAREHGATAVLENPKGGE